MLQMTSYKENKPNKTFYEVSLQPKHSTKFQKIFFFLRNLKQVLYYHFFVSEQYGIHSENQLRYPPLHLGNDMKTKRCSSPPPLHPAPPQISVSRDKRDQLKARTCNIFHSMFNCVQVLYTTNQQTSVFRDI